MRGWIYIAQNPSFEGLLKIGYSDRDPSIRMEELYTTGVPTPFVQLYVMLVEDAYAVEQNIHAELDYCRDSKSREFFRCELAKVISVLEELKKNKKLNIKFEEFHQSVILDKSFNKKSSTLDKKFKEPRRKNLTVKPAPGMQRLFGIEVPVDWVIKFSGSGWTVAKNNQEWHVETGDELKKLLVNKV